MFHSLVEANIQIPANAFLFTFIFAVVTSVARYFASQVVESRVLKEIDALMRNTRKKIYEPLTPIRRINALTHARINDLTL